MMSGKVLGCIDKDDARRNLVDVISCHGGVDKSGVTEVIDEDVTVI